MSSLVSPKLGFQVPSAHHDNGGPKLKARLSRAGVDAARRKFTPEFLNRLDKMVVFRPLGSEELNRILEIELKLVQQRIQSSAVSQPFFINVTDSARELLLTEGTDFRYGARPLKRAIERLLVQPLSNLMATGQIHSRDHIRVIHDDASGLLTFLRETEGFEVREGAARAAA
jgi:ATP-dependent Clp protease ATP-binding subunit ClpB